MCYKDVYFVKFVCDGGVGGFVVVVVVVVAAGVVLLLSSSSLLLLLLFFISDIIEQLYIFVYYHKLLQEFQFRYMKLFSFYQTCGHASVTTY